MGKRVVLAVIGVILAVCVAAAGWYWFYSPMDSWNYEENREELDNPARGFYYQVDSGVEELPEEIGENGLRLMLLAYDLSDTVRTGEDGERVYPPVPEEKLRELDRALGLAEEAGLKVIFRAAYGFSSSDEYGDPDDVEVVAGHIRQIAPVLNEHAGSILCVQAGFLGPWGEWHHSNLLSGDEDKDARVRNRVLEEWLGQLDDRLSVNVRRPRFIRSAAGTGLDVERLGFHNDALLSGEDDMGTYDDVSYDRGAELDWMEKNLVWGLNGGEMPALSEYTEPENAIAEFEQIHLTYLNSDYNKEVLEDWRKRPAENDRPGQGGGARESVYDVIGRRLGYRLSLGRLSLNERLSGFQKLSLEVGLRNTGFAPVMAGYELYVAVDNGEERLIYPVGDMELGQIMPGGEAAGKLEIRFDELIDRKGKKGKPETISIGLLLTDSAEPLKEADLSRKAIRLANDETVWEDGINYIGQYQLSKGRYVWSTDGVERRQGDSGEDVEKEEGPGGLAQMTAFKIGKADAILLTSEGETVLIDTGEDEDAWEILDEMERQGIRRIDHLILTHFDKDHVGGADKILSNMDVRHIYQPDYDEDSGQYEEYDDTVTELRIPVSEVKRVTEFTAGEMSVTIFPPREEWYEDDNDYSLVTSIVHGQNRFLFAGDAESERLRELLDGGLGEEPRHLLLKMPHHGRIEDETGDFLDEVQPRYAIITCSDKNPPDEEVLRLLEDRGIETYLTREGNITVISDGEALEIRQ